jgi:hypothetical protein
MNEPKFEGRTKSEWMDLNRKTGGNISTPPPRKIREAIAWFDSDEKQSDIDRQERHFQLQLDQNRSTATRALSVSVLGLLLALAAFGFSLWQHFSKK